ncbi:hypothetical protein [Paenibacillus xanthanilyticus]|uniref:Transposase n=1 Tax=Paenibacillus xanthanilyticus TaxID=1783531 RepID=A0ABV8K1U2_9BACL
MVKSDFRREIDAIQQSIVDEASLLLELDYEEIRRERFAAKGTFCPHCRHETGKLVVDYVYYGHVYRTKWQRYRCRQCNRIFSDLTQTFFHRSRNVQKWPLFIQYLMVDRLSLKQIAVELKLHYNTICAWNKKLMAFIERFLPNGQLQPYEEPSYDTTTIQVNNSNKGLPPKNCITLTRDTNTSKGTSIQVVIAVNRENPSQFRFKIENVASLEINPLCTAQSSLIKKTTDCIQSFLAKKRGINSRNLFMHLTYFRMLKLIEALNPFILPKELFALCLDQENLLSSKRLLKRLI